MRKGTRLIIAVIILCAIGLGTAIYKNNKMGVPLWKGKQPSVWLIEAKTTFFSTGSGPISVHLALPNKSDAPILAGEEAGSMGFGYETEITSLGRRAVWSTRVAPEKSHALYYRLFLPYGSSADNGETPVKGEAPIAQAPGLGGSVKEVAQELVELAKSRSANADTLFMHLLSILKERQSSQELVILRRYYTTEERIDESEVFQRMSIDLLNMAGVPARLAYGVKLEEKLNSQQAIPLVEYCDGITWKTRDFNEPNTAFSNLNIFIWNQGERPLLEVYGGENSKVVFTAVKDEIPIDRMAEMRNSSFLASTILGLPISERVTFSYVVLIPVGAFVVVLMRNIVGIATLGTFMPVLLALAFLEMPLLDGIIMFIVIVAVGLYFRFLLSSMNLLVVPRVAACVVIVTLLMLLMSMVSWKLGMRGVLQITVFPMIIIAWTIERMSLIWEEEGKRNAIKQVGGSVIVAVIAYSIMRIPQVKYWAQYFPELLLVLLAAIILIGRYTGYRISELIRFKNFALAEPQTPAE